MSNGDDEPDADPAGGDGEPAADEESAPEAADAEEAADDEAAAEPPDRELSAEAIAERLDDIESRVEEAETEADLDELEAELDVAAEDVERADLPEPEDEDETPPEERLQDRVDGVREAIAEARGPYAEDVVEGVESARTTIEEGEWTEQGEEEVAAAVESYLETAGEHTDAEFDAGSRRLEDLREALADVAAAVEAADLDPDDDAETIGALVEATEQLRADLEDAQEWEDLSVRQKLRAQGFYDRLTSQNRKDFPPELSVIRIAEQENDPERVLMGLEYFTSEFMEENCMAALNRMGASEAYDAMAKRAGKRDKGAIEVLGSIGDERALDTLLDFIEGDANPPLQKVTLQALGEIGSPEATQNVADRLVAEDDEIRSGAARALGLIGDTRAIEPLSDLLADDDSDVVRASAAWALNRIGTRKALEAAAEYADDRSYLVQREAESADDALSREATA